MAAHLANVTCFSLKGTGRNFGITIACWKLTWLHFTAFIFCSVDATAESGRLGRLINHSKATRNASVKLYETTAGPKLIIVAAKDIQPDEEILFDYGDRSKSSVEAFPWLLT